MGQTPGVIGESQAASGNNNNKAPDAEQRQKLESAASFTSKLTFGSNNPYIFISSLDVPASENVRKKLPQRLAKYKFASILECSKKGSTGYFVVFPDSVGGQNAASKCYRSCHSTRFCDYNLRMKKHDSGFSSLNIRRDYLNNITDFSGPIDKTDNSRGASSRRLEAESNCTTPTIANIIRTNGTNTNSVSSSLIKHSPSEISFSEPSAKRQKLHHEGVLSLAGSRNKALTHLNDQHGKKSLLGDTIRGSDGQTGSPTPFSVEEPTDNITECIADALLQSPNGILSTHDICDSILKTRPSYAMHASRGTLIRTIGATLLRKKLYIKHPRRSGDEARGHLWSMRQSKGAALNPSSTDTPEYAIIGQASSSVRIIVPPGQHDKLPEWSTLESLSFIDYNGDHYSKGDTIVVFCMVDGNDQPGEEFAFVRDIRRLPDNEVMLAICWYYDKSAMKKLPKQRVVWPTGCKYMLSNSLELIQLETIIRKINGVELAGFHRQKILDVCGDPQIIRDPDEDPVAWTITLSQDIGDGNVDCKRLHSVEPQICSTESPGEGHVANYQTSSISTTRKTDSPVQITAETAPPVEPAQVAPSYFLEWKELYNSEVRQFELDKQEARNAIEVDKQQALRAIEVEKEKAQEAIEHQRQQMLEVIELERRNVQRNTEDQKREMLEAFEIQRRQLTEAMELERQKSEAITQMLKQTRLDIEHQIRQTSEAYAHKVQRSKMMRQQILENNLGWNQDFVKPQGRDFRVHDHAEGREAVNPPSLNASHLLSQKKATFGRVLPMLPPSSSILMQRSIPPEEGRFTLVRIGPEGVSTTSQLLDAPLDFPTDLTPVLHGGKLAYRTKDSEDGWRSVYVLESTELEERGHHYDERNWQFLGSTDMPQDVVGNVK